MSGKKRRRDLERIAKKYGGTLVERKGHAKIRLPGGGSVWCSMTPRRPVESLEGIERDIRRELNKKPR